MKNVQEIIDNRLCTGCGLCAALIPNVRMEVDSEGFLTPSGIKENINNDLNAKILSICPGINQINKNKDTSKENKIWGRIEVLKSGHSSDEEIRHKGSSGGVLTAIAIYLIESNMVTGVLQNTVSKNNPIENLPCLSKSKIEIISNAGSRYAPTSILQILPELLKSNEKLAIIGKPCDISAAHNFLVENPKYKSQVPYMFSFYCAGQPSYFATQKLLNQMGCNDEIDEFRYRGHGWPGDATAITKDGIKYTMSYNDSWGKILGKEIHFRCKICPDGVGYFADIVCADAWDTKDGYPDFKEKDGESLIIAKTSKGALLLEELINKGVIISKQLEIDKIKKIQPYQFNRRVVIGARILGFIFSKKYILNFKGFNLLKNSFSTNFRNLFSNFLGTYKRSSKKK
ncbi:MAG: Coenzyme F420 hydrogenase/dehydrogenase, beta subunit C-terminal domain [Tissierellia bacterium]|nr:Coenzyme F420 hydrogenase/dehydrogenase, beta subunit C-terminal domain [Tissierellia bacterium]MDD4781695.1 Coenzyme F420 hydrogenase/dehydrogenase, beta subunit C-terminal domain [Tissierellia bacterium]